MEQPLAVLNKQRRCSEGVAMGATLFYGIRRRFVLPLSCERTSPTKLNRFLQTGARSPATLHALFNRQPQDRRAVERGIHARKQRDCP